MFLVLGIFWIFPIVVHSLMAFIPLCSCSL
jgi:hypothetical protein